MAGTDPLSNTLVTRTVNFHGHQLLKQLTSSYPKDFEALNLKEVDYKVYRARIPEIRFVYESYAIQILINLNKSETYLLLTLKYGHTFHGYPWILKIFPSMAVQIWKNSAENHRLV